MPPYICITCGVQQADTDEPPELCAVCQDERQFVGWGGQRWTTLQELRVDHENTLLEEEPNLISVATNPLFGIGQRALLVLSKSGNVLWDCTVLCSETVDRIQELGGVAAIAVSHPHFYSMVVEWSAAFDDAPAYLHVDDADWVQRPDPRIVPWQGETLEVGAGITLIRCGGHFPGGAVLHWKAGAEGRGALLTGDIIQVVQDRRWVSFMYSYPNLIPQSADSVHRVVAAVEPYDFERIYGAWPGRVILEDAKGAVRRSAERYARRLTLDA